MVSTWAGRFRLELLEPTGEVLRCRCSSVILPGHDGHLGILRNHAPMMCSLGAGILEVHGIVDEEDKYYVLDGGFATVSENLVTVLAYEVLTFEGLTGQEQIEMYRKAQEVFTGQDYILTQKGQGDIEKARLVVRMAKMAGVSF